MMTPLESLPRPAGLQALALGAESAPEVNQRDYRAFIKAVREGRLKAIGDV